MPCPLITLVHSPLVGPATWEPIACAIEDRDHEVAVPDLRPTLADGPPYAARQVQAVTSSVSDRPTLLVGHSGAGPLLGAVADRLRACALGYVFVDAGLPAPGTSWFQTMPAGLVDQLRDMVEDGWLPAWPLWWDSAELAALLPDAGPRERFVAGCPRLPVAMFEEVLPPTPHWEDRPGAYLRLSTAYREPADRARDLGWPVVELASDHLAVLTNPALVVDPLLDLAAEVQR